jgi:hypothetical protein
MLVSRLHIELDQLESGTTPQIHAGGNIGVVFLSFPKYNYKL